MKVEDGIDRWDLGKDEAMAQSMRHARIPLCITDPALPDNPIVFANTAFCELTGYSLDEVVGHNCRFLQGEETSAESVIAVREAIRDRKVETVEILNYRKDGTTFLNSLQIGPILDDSGELKYIFGSQLDVTAKHETERQARELADAELLHRLRNIVNVMNVIIRMTAREESDTKVLATKITSRLAALSKAHFQTIGRPGDQNPSFGALAEMMLKAYAPCGPQQFSLSGPETLLPDHLITSTTLCLHELATNSVKHGALSVEAGVVDLGWEIVSAGDAGNIVFRWSEAHGPIVTKPERSSGSKIIGTLAEAAGGSMSFDWRESGLIVEAVFPL